ncbi:hypothetical protein GPECTOR_15g521 [Gonium pectorale]|uniref:Uncharacterized protein n=1 Tax=Gonium pectorale TaxID=33097 RepID=A0A150GM57_GONPE|nr:hypothetical protein GPECTOR_15g521 [Gonium pectorale]|eukprot:KXZ50835.1 hypothetical protein GPECTOR_15g521 [Gonium pectorale]
MSVQDRAHGYGSRCALRLAQLATALLGVLTLLPTRQGAQIAAADVAWAALNEEDGSLLAGDLLATAGALLGFGLPDVGSGTGGAPGVLSSLEDMQQRQVLLSLQVALGALLVLWLLQAWASSRVACPPGGAAVAAALVMPLKSHLDLQSLEVLISSPGSHTGSAAPAGGDPWVAARAAAQAGGELQADQCAVAVCLVELWKLAAAPPMLGSPSAPLQRPWSMLVGCLSALACLMWLALIAPPLAALGEGPADLFLGLLETGPGAVALLAALVMAALALLGAAGMAAWCGASGELSRRWRGDRVEGRRLQCLAWACGPAVAVAGASALSWALGEERNAAAFLAAEALRCAALWPLVWLQEPWLLVGGVEAVGGCVQHSGCGVTCCVLRWCGLRPRSCAVPGGRCDAPGSGSGGGGGGAGVGRERGENGEVGTGARGQAARRAYWNLQVDVN